MILDNENKNLKVHEWISRYTEEGELDIVTGYFTIGALAFLSDQINAEIKQYKLMLGDIVKTEGLVDRPVVESTWVEYQWFGNLYFLDHMKEHEIDVLDFVEKDIEKALQGQKFDSLNNAKKEEVIQQLHAEWTDPKNEVVKRMAMFKEKSPHILKPILES